MTRNAKPRPIWFGLGTLTLGFAATAPAATIEWDNEGGDYLWSTAANWKQTAPGAANDVLPSDTAPGDDLVFAGGIPSGSERTINTQGNRAANKITFNNTFGSRLSIGPSSSTTDTLTLGGGGIVRGSAVPGGANTSGDSRIHSRVILGASQTWNLGFGGEMQIEQPVQGSGFNLTKTGPAILRLSNTGTLGASGSTYNHFNFQGGTVRFTNNSSGTVNTLGTGTINWQPDTSANTLFNFNTGSSQLNAQNTLSRNVVFGLAGTATASASRQFTLTMDDTNAKTTFNEGYGRLNVAGTLSGTLSTGAFRVVGGSQSDPNGSILFSAAAGNSYSAGTTIVGAFPADAGAGVAAGGTVLVSNTTGSAFGGTNVSVEANATLGGTGIVTGDTAVGGRIAPGLPAASAPTAAALGTLTLGNTEFKAGSSLAAQLGGAASDLLDVVGLLDLDSGGNTLAITGTADGLTSYVLAAYDDIAGTFASVLYNGSAALPDGYRLTYTSADGPGQIVLAVPEPASLGLVALGGALVLGRRRAEKA